MATVNPFDLLGDDDTDDLTQLVAAQKVKAPASLTPAAAKKGSAQAPPVKTTAAANLPSKPLPPSQAVREARNETQRGGGRGGGDGRGRGRGRGGRRYDRDYGDNENSSAPSHVYSGGLRGTEDTEAGKTNERRGYSGYGGTRGGFHGGRRSGFGNGNDSADGEYRPRRAFERHSGTGHGNEIKREGAGRGNWGTPSDEIVGDVEEPVNEVEKIVDSVKESGPEAAENDKKDSTEAESDEKKEQEAENQEMTLEEYEKILEEKRKALLVLKAEERKVDLDKEFHSMQLLSNKKNDDEVFVKLGTDKDKRKEAVDKAKKSLSINEFLKPAEGENYYHSGGRGRGRGRGRGGHGGSTTNYEAPSIEDVGQFPTLGSN